MLSPLASSMMASGIVQIEHEFNTTGATFVTFTVSIYVYIPWPAQHQQKNV